MTRDFGEAPQQGKGRGDCVDGGMFWQDDWGGTIRADEGVLVLWISYLWFVTRFVCGGWADWGW
jgi:hypothetical protein